MSCLYEEDFYAWCLRQSKVLELGLDNDLDWKNLKEEIESLGRKEKKELRSRLEILFIHLIKWKMQPDHRDRNSGSWLGSIRVQRMAIFHHLKDCPSLKSSIDEIAKEAYEEARNRVPLEAPIVEEDIPLEMPFSIEEALQEGWLPV